MAGMKLYDMHCDVIRKLWREQKQGFTTDLLENTHHVDLKRMQQSGYGLQCFAVYVNQQEDDSTIFSAQEQIDIGKTKLVLTIPGQGHKTHSEPVIIAEHRKIAAARLPTLNGEKR